MMNCNEIQELLVEFILLDLNDSQAREVQAHLDSNCLVCGREYTEILEGAELVFEVSPA